MTLYHDSRDSLYRTPSGAQVCGAVVTLRLRAPKPPLSATLRTWKDGREAHYPMTPCARELYEARIELPPDAGNLWYYFILDYGGETAYYGNARDGLGGEGAAYEAEPPSFQITVYPEGARAPDWMRDAVMYQVMIDRFRASRPPAPDRYPPGARLHASVLEPPELKIEAGDNLARDFYGGDLPGLTQKLPYLRDLGITALYLNPVFSSPSNHKYDTSDYEHIDPAFGTNEDFRLLCRRAKALGMRVILDGVFSHTGSDSRYFNRLGRFADVGAYQSKASKYYSWYNFTRWPDEYKSWWGFETLPEVDKSSEGFMDYIIRDEDAIAARWLACGASGWRLDVADELPMPFLRALRARVKREGDDNALIGEVWEDASNKLAYGEARNYCLGDTLDSCMNYPLRDALIAFMCFRIDACTLARRIEALQENYPPHFFYATMNLLGSHDKPRVISLLAGLSDADLPREARHAHALNEREYALGRKRFIALWKFLTSLPGMPSLYYGDEAGLYGMADPFCRGAYPWGFEDLALIDAIGRANRLRNDHAVLRAGDLRLYAPARDVVVCERTDPTGAHALFALNRADEAVTYRLPGAERSVGAIDCDCEIFPARVQ
jgi:4-alpha-glucanotransferase